jgi:hypothetical protein
VHHGQTACEQEETIEEEVVVQGQKDRTQRGAALWLVLLHI